MHKLKLVVGSILFSASLNAYASFPCEKKCSFISPSCGSFTLGISGLDLRPSIPHLDYSLLYPNNPAFSSEGGTYQSVAPNYELGYKAYIGYEFPCSGLDVLVGYTQYGHHFDPATTSTEPFSLFSAFFFGTSNDLGLVNFPVTFPTGLTILADVSAPISQASMQLKSDYKAWDLEFGQTFYFGNCFKTRWFGGLRYVDLDQDLNARYFGNGSADLSSGLLGSTARASVDSSLTLTQKSNYHGIGPRLGMSGSVEVYKNIHLIAEGSSSLIVGEINSTFADLFRQIVDATLIVAGSGVPIPGTGLTFTNDSIFSFRHPDETRIVPNLEGKLGINYNYCLCNSHTIIKLEAGWLSTHYFNSFDRLSAVGAPAPEQRTRQTISTDFSGPYVDLSIKI